MAGIGHAEEMRLTAAAAGSVGAALRSGPERLLTQLGVLPAVR
jgi:hypothetical protein